MDIVHVAVRQVHGVPKILTLELCTGGRRPPRPKTPALKFPNNWGERIFIYSCAASLISFEMDFFHIL